MRFARLLLLILLGWYLTLACGHYFNQRPLWNDEQCIFNNIIQLKPSCLFSRPLLSDQEFPRLYLWTIQQFSNLFDGSLLSLRFFSFLAMLAAFGVWFKIGRTVLEDAWDRALFVGCWCGSMPLVYYAAELKPYSMDVLASGLIVLFLLNQKELQKKHRRYQLILFFLPALCLWSYASIFLLLLPLYSLIRECFAKGRWLPELTFFLAGYGLCLGFIYTFDYRVTQRGLMEVYWHDYFFRFDSWKGFLSSLGKGMNNLVARCFAEHPRWVKGPSRAFMGLGIGTMITCFWSHFKKDRFSLLSVIPICFALFMIQMGLSILHVFPFAVPRLTLFFYPLLFLMTIQALHFLRAYNKVLGIVVQILFAGYLVFISAGIAGDIFLKKDLGAEAVLFINKGDK